LGRRDYEPKTDRNLVKIRFGDIRMRGLHHSVVLDGFNIVKTRGANLPKAASAVSIIPAAGELSIHFGLAYQQA
jgi:hypothetical protein